MMAYKSVTERYWNEQLTDNSVLNHNAQCKDCIFRDKTTVDGKEYGWQKCVCQIYGRATVDEDNKTDPGFFKYRPVKYEDKPNGIYENTEVCDYYEKEE